MVLLGLDVKHELQEMTSFFNQKEINVYNEYSFNSGEWGAIDGMRFFEIERGTEKNGGFVFGRENELCNLYKRCEQSQDNCGYLYKLTENGFENTGRTLKEALTTSIRSYEEDIAFWLSFIKDFVQKYGNLMLMRYYEGIDVPYTIISVSADNTTKEHLLTIDVNQGLLITK